MKSSLASAALFAALASSSPAGASPRWDHRGSVGLLAGTGLQLKQGSPVAGRTDVGNRTPIDLGVSVAVGENGNEAVLVGRLELGGPARVYALYGGYRGYFGQEQVKTFFDLDLAAQLQPGFAIGPRIGFGLQYELAQVVGINVSAGAQGAFGTSLRYSFDLLVGIQLRSYLFD